MKLEEINALRGLDRDELIAKAATVGLVVDARDVGSIKWPTLDSIRLAIIEKTVEDEGGGSPLSKLGAEHFHEARRIHAHGMELHLKATRLRREGEPAEAPDLEADAERHFIAARSAAALAQSGLTAAVLESLGEFLGQVGR